MRKKTKNKNIIITSILLIVILVVTILTISIIKETKKSQENMTIIKDNYIELSTNVKEYNQIRTDLSEKINNFVYENYPKEHEEYVQLLSKYNENIKKIDSNIANIEPKCNVIYKELSVNKICDSYKELYEKLINLYISDIENYNNKITSYNEYKKESINQFEMVHKEYIDYNLDQIYKGKDENNETNKEEK